MLNELSRYDVSLKKMFRESQRKTDQVKKLRVHPYQSTINRTDVITLGRLALWEMLRCIFTKDAEEGIFDDDKDGGTSGVCW